jgi:hypothetical protein
MSSRNVDLSNCDKSLHRRGQDSGPRPKRIPRIAAGTFWPSLALAIAVVACGGATDSDAQVVTGGSAGFGGNGLSGGGAGGTGGGLNPDAGTVDADGATQDADARTDVEAGFCAEGFHPGYLQPGCGADAVLGCLHDMWDACAGIFCGCDGVTYFNDCEGSSKPFRGRGVCADATVDATADGATGSSVCPALETHTVGAWVQSHSADAGAFFGDRLTTFDFEGTIESIDIALPDAGALLYPGANLQKTMLSIVDANGTPWSVGYSLPEATTTISVGDHVAVHYDYIWRSFDALKIHLSIAKAGSTLVYVGIGGVIEDLMGSPVLLAAGATVCQKVVPCLTYQGFDLLAVAEAGTVALPLGATRTVGACRVTHDGFFHTVSGTTTCADAFVAEVRVGVQCQP